MWEAYRENWIGNMYEVLEVITYTVTYNLILVMLILLWGCARRSGPNSPHSQNLVNFPQEDTVSHSHKNSSLDFGWGDDKNNFQIQLTLTESSASNALNWANIWCSGLRHMLANVFKRPRWAKPIMNDSTPKADERSMTSLRQGIKTSQPSKPKRFSEDHFLAKKFSKLQWNHKKRC